MSNENKGNNMKNQLNQHYQNLADSMTSEQYLKLVEFAHGPVPSDIAAMTDDEILAELGA